MPVPSKVLACVIHIVRLARLAGSFRSELGSSRARLGPDPVVVNKTEGAHAALFVSGVVDRLLLLPLLENVVQANTHRGMAMDLFVSMAEQPKRKPFAASSRESAWLKAEDTRRYIAEPGTLNFMRSNGTVGHFLASLCRQAEAAGVLHCEGRAEPDVPVALPNDSVHRSSIYYYSPFKTTTGEHLLKKWRSLDELWERALAVEKARGVDYNQVLVVRDDAYWSMPYHLDAREFLEDPLLLVTAPCLQSHGVNDKVLHMGRKAAGILMQPYKTWLEGEPGVVKNCRNAEEFILRVASQKGVHSRLRGMPMALASFTTGGLPCFRKQYFREDGGYHTCYGEEHDGDSLTKFFHDFSCDLMNYNFYDMLSPGDVSELHGAIARLAGPERHPFILTVTDSAMVDLARNMLGSLEAVGEEAGVLVVGIESGVCSALGDFAECLDFPLHTAQGGRASAWGSSEYGKAVLLKHAILTISLSSGLSSGLLFTDPDIVFLRSPMEEMRLYAGTKDVIFSSNNALAQNPRSCSDVSQRYGGSDGIPELSIGQRGFHLDINTGLLYLRHTVAATNLLLKSWAILNEEESNGRNHFQQWSMVKAIEESPWVRLAPVPCERFVNGNVFWGHRYVLDMEEVYSVHANWMHTSLKRTCLERANLWGPFPPPLGGTLWREPEKLNVELNHKGLIIDCNSGSLMEQWFGWLGLPTGTSSTVASASLFASLFMVCAISVGLFALARWLTTKQKLWGADSFERFCWVDRA